MLKSQKVSTIYHGKRRVLVKDSTETQMIYANPEPMLISVKQMKSPNHSILANEDIRMDVEI